MMKDIVRIACALINKFGKPLLVESDKHLKILKEVEDRLEMPNLMADKVKEFELKKNKKWTKATSGEVIGFPRLSEADIWQISLGPYQIQKGQRYTERDLKLDPLYRVLIHKEQDGLIRVKLQSKYRRAVTHNLWVEFCDDPMREPAKRILGYFCYCEQGARNLGCCAHVAAVLLYLGRDAYDPQPQPKRRLGSFLLLDAAEAVCRREARQASDGSDASHVEETESQLEEMESQVEEMEGGNEDGNDEQESELPSLEQLVAMDESENLELESDEELLDP